MDFRDVTEQVPLFSRNEFHTVNIADTGLPSLRPPVIPPSLHTFVLQLSELIAPLFLMDRIDAALRAVLSLSSPTDNSAAEAPAEDGPSSGAIPRPPKDDDVGRLIGTTAEGDESLMEDNLIGQKTLSSKEYHDTHQAESPKHETVKDSEENAHLSAPLQKPPEMSQEPDSSKRAVTSKAKSGNPPVEAAKDTTGNALAEVKSSPMVGSTTTSPPLRLIDNTSTARDELKPASVTPAPSPTTYYRGEVIPNILLQGVPILRSGFEDSAQSEAQQAPQRFTEDRSQPSSFCVGEPVPSEDRQERNDPLEPVVIKGKERWADFEDEDDIGEWNPPPIVIRPGNDIAIPRVEEHVQQVAAPVKTDPRPEYVKAPAQVSSIDEAQTNTPTSVHNTPFNRAPGTIQSARKEANDTPGSTVRIEPPNEPDSRDGLATNPTEALSTDFPAAVSHGPTQTDVHAVEPVLQMFDPLVESGPAVETPPNDDKSTGPPEPSSKDSSIVEATDSLPGEASRPMDGVLKDKTVSETFPEVEELAPTPVSRATTLFGQEELPRDGLFRSAHSPRVTEISPRQWKDRAYAMNHRAHENHTDLDKLVQRHGSSIIDIWTKKDVEKRKRLLRRVWPDMAVSHRPDLKVLMEREKTNDFLSGPAPEGEVSEGGPSAETERNCLLLPYISLEDLGTNRLPLLQMILKRACFTPAHFVFHDMPPGRREFLELFIRFEGVPDHFTVVKPDTYTYDDKREIIYAQLVTFDDTKASSKAVCDKEAMPSELGLVLLEVQDRLYKFLLDATVAILDKKVEHLLGEDFEWQPMPTVPSTSEGTATDAMRRYEGVYLGSTINHVAVDETKSRLRNSLRVVRATMNEAMDHWHFLQTDPGYLLATISNSPGAGAWARSPLESISAALVNSLSYWLYWEELFRKISCVQTGGFKPEIHPRAKYESRVRLSTMPEDKRHEVARCLLYSLTSRLEGPAVRAFMSAAKDQPHGPQGPQGADNKEKKQEQWYYLGRLVMWLDDPKMRHLLGLQTILDEIERLASSSLKEFQRWSDPANWRFRDLDTLSAVFYDEFRSAADSKYKILTSTARHLSLLESETRLHQEKWANVVRDYAFSISSSWRAIDPDKSLQLRIDEPVKSKEDKRKRKIAEEAIKKFMAHLKQMLRIQDAWYCRDIMRDEDDIWGFQEPPGDPQGEGSADGTSSSNKSVSAQQLKGAKKDSNSIDDSGGEPFGGSYQVYHFELALRLDMDRRALDVLQTMFPPQSGNGPSKSATWKDVQYALRQALYQMRGLHGCAWLVSPPEAEDERFIFRPPGKDDKIPAERLRLYGMRMQAWGLAPKGHYMFRLRKTPEQKEQEREQAKLDFFKEVGVEPEEVDDQKKKNKKKK